MVTEAEAREGTHLLHVGNGRNSLLNGRGDQPLHVGRTEQGSLGDDLYLVVGDVGHGIDGQMCHRVSTPAYQSQREQADEQLMGDGKVSDAVEHGLLSERRIS